MATKTKPAPADVRAERIEAIAEAERNRAPLTFDPGGWRKLVAAVADGEELVPENVAETLREMGRTAEQLAEAADRLVERRRLAEIAGEEVARRAAFKLATEKLADAEAAFQECQRRDLEKFHARRRKLTDAVTARQKALEESLAAAVSLKDGCSEERKAAWLQAVGRRNGIRRTVNELQDRLVPKALCQIEATKETIAQRADGGNYTREVRERDARSLEADQAYLRAFESELAESRAELAAAEKLVEKQKAKRLLP